ncbi:hypothetical protein SAMN05421676_11245 [Salinibacillus kushneri]|uniref:Uncharacterized protein n=1 Tax=Salinibacillus kushneri TaxID=237682 RepID=A0A1I0IF85_9BACI|nr:VVA0879 family protein [Salinibacillus kushneri]SET95427.1 hypothetical protein SAMN05421676_11245 [Salinibacillus kushneri]
MEKLTLNEWLEEGSKLFGENKLKWKFKCPACGHLASIEDFVEHDADPNDAYQKCIGRVNGKGTKNQTDLGHGCNWAAYGLFGTLDKGRTVISEDGDEVSVFDFALSEEAV